MPKTKQPITERQQHFIAEYVIDCDAINEASDGYGGGFDRTGLGLT